MADPFTSMFLLGLGVGLTVGAILACFAGRCR